MLGEGRGKAVLEIKPTVVKSCTTELHPSLNIRNFTYRMDDCLNAPFKSNYKSCNSSSVPENLHSKCKSTRPEAAARSVWSLAIRTVVRDRTFKK